MMTAIDDDDEPDVGDNMFVNPLVKALGNRILKKYDMRGVFVY